MKKYLDDLFKVQLKENNPNIDSVKRHLNKYLGDLKLHFNLSDADIQKVLIETYYANKPQNPFVKCLSMLKYWN